MLQSCLLKTFQNENEIIPSDQVNISLEPKLTNYFIIFFRFALLELLKDIWNRQTHSNVLQFLETPGKSNSVIYVVQLPHTILLLLKTTETLSLNRLIDVICTISALTDSVLYKYICKHLFWCQQ